MRSRLASLPGGIPSLPAFRQLNFRREAIFHAAFAQYESREARDGVLKSSMEEGIKASYAKLAELLSPSA